MSSKFTGRGGAGNVDIGDKKDPSNSPPPDLETPTIKADKYTTGRGGSGNMAKNDKERPELARTAQDVGSSPVEGPESRGETMHYGRGGAANVIKAQDPHNIKGAEKDKVSKSRSEELSGEQQRERSQSPGFLNRAKEGIERVRRYSSNKKETT